MWAPDSPINRLPGGWDDDLARSFALRAIAAQPSDYLASVAHDVSLAFHWTPAAHPRRTSGAYRFGQGRQALPPPAYPSAGAALRAYDPDVHASYPVTPYAGFLVTYQKVAYLRGPLLGAILLVGALGLRRRTLLPYGAAVALLVAPVAVLDFGHRYVLPVVPLACVAAALGTGRLRGRARQVLVRIPGVFSGPRTRRRRRSPAR